MGIKPRFTRAQVKNALDAYLDRIVFALIETLKYTGENFVTNARNSGSYSDRTGNLRSSVGYMIMHNGKIIHKAFGQTGGTTEGASEGEQYAMKVAEAFKGKRIVFIGVAGMEYAAAVESKGFDVISGSATGAVRDLKQQLLIIKNKLSA